MIVVTFFLVLFLVESTARVTSNFEKLNTEKSVRTTLT